MGDNARMEDATRRVRRIYDREAARYDKAIKVFERLFFGEGREWVCSRASGDVLELACGTGRNLPFYPARVRFTGVELSPEMLGIARDRADRLGMKADLRSGDAQRLDFPDASFDTVVFTLALCTIPDPALAVAEAHRVLRPGGRLLLLEHVRSPLLPVRALQRALEPLSIRFQADHLLREPLLHLRERGFQIGAIERSKLGIVERVAARKPG